MSETELAARLAAHGHAFEGLLDLIPAKFYNPEDASNQWSKRKQTKEEAKQAKRAKLDPDQSSHKSIMQNGAIKPELADENDQDQDSATLSTKKKKKTNTKSTATKVLPRSRKAATKIQESISDSKGHKKSHDTGSEDQKNAVPEQHAETKVEEAVNSNRPAFSVPDPNRNITDLRAKLAAKIEALRSKRKAPGSNADGAPKSRDAILEARRTKEDARRERKKLDKEARKDAAQEIKIEHDDDDANDAIENQDDSSDDAEEEGASQQISYGKVAFSDGDRLDADGNLSASRKRKQQDTPSALQAALNKKARLAALPSDKQDKIADSDSWHKALLQADGEKVKDDLGKLKKAVKRQESIKKKSTKEWKERLSTIAKSKALKQKNREQNLKDRRDSKGKSGGHKKGKQIGAYQGKKSTKGKGKSSGF